MNIRRQLAQIVTTTREYIEEQVQLGFLDIDEETKGTVDQQNFFQDNDLKTREPLYTGLNLENLKMEALDCHKCQLDQSRTHVVFGIGNQKADLMFVGEAPGAEEDRTGKPFVGRAGQLLTKIIQSIGLTRDDVYIANVLKCRPPSNRNPKLNEIEQCEPYLLRQIELIKPKVICALGTFAAQILLRTDERISKLRGDFYSYHGTKVMPTYHPAYLLRNPENKRQVWEDIQKVMAELRLSIPD
ncbi:MAG: uracil-DNA glycosylase [Candidatus Poribacteria bacterium]|nr:uracil-DNA glycosylase [Candidatus Poribacteria bacterium]